MGNPFPLGESWNIIKKQKNGDTFVTNFKSLASGHYVTCYECFAMCAKFLRKLNSINSKLKVFHIDTGTPKFIRCYSFGKKFVNGFNKNTPNAFDQHVTKL